MKIEKAKALAASQREKCKTDVADKLDAVIAEAEARGADEIDLLDALAAEDDDARQELQDAIDAAHARGE